MANGMTYQEGLDAVEARFKTFGIQPHTPFLRAINEEIKTQMQTRQADQIARSVLGCILAASKRSLNTKPRLPSIQLGYS